MSTTAELETLTEHFATQWAAETEIAWPNVEFDPANMDEWVRFTILHGDAEQKSAGGSVNLHRSYGTLIIQIFVKPDSGAKRASQLVDLVSNIWRGLHLSNMVFRTPYTTEMGVEDSWYQVNVSCAFHRNDIV